MFDLLVSLGAELHVKNKQGLTPLTLSAKLARKDVSSKKRLNRKDMNAEKCLVFVVARQKICKVV